MRHLMRTRKYRFGLQNVCTSLVGGCQIGKSSPNSKKGWKKKHVRNHHLVRKQTDRNHEDLATTLKSASLMDRFTDFSLLKALLVLVKPSILWVSPLSWIPIKTIYHQQKDSTKTCKYYRIHVSFKHKSSVHQLSFIHLNYLP